LQSTVRFLLSWAARNPVKAFALSLGLGLGAFFFDPLFISRTFGDRDLLPFFLPIEKAVHAAWRAGRVPLLLPEISFGRLLAANPNTGAFYPLRIAMAVLPFAFAFKLFPILHLWIAGVGVFRLAARRGCSTGGSTLAGLILAFSGPAISEIAYPNLLPGLAWMPWLITAALDIRRVPSARRGALLGAIWLVMLLAGDVVTCGLGFLGSVLAFVEEDGPKRGRALASLGGGFLVGSLAGSIQIFPALLYTPLSVRALGRFTLQQSLLWSVHPWRFVELAVPFPFGNVAAAGRVWGEKLWYGKASGFFLTLYMGIFAALSWAIARPRRRLFLHGFALFSLVGATVGSLIPAELLSRTSPVPLRYPEKLLAGFVVASALAAAHAFDRLGGRRGSVAGLVIAAVLAAGALYVRGRPSAFARFVAQHWSSPRGGSIAAAELPLALTIAAVSWAVGAAILFYWKPGRLAPVLLIGFVALDLAVLDLRFVSTIPQSWLTQAPPSARALFAENRGEVYGFFPLWDNMRHIAPGSTRGAAEAIEDIRTFLWGNTGAAWSVVYTFNIDYDESDLYRVDLARREITREAGADPGVGRYLAAFSARTTLLDVGHHWHGFPVQRRRIGREMLFTNPDALPRIRLAQHVREVPGVAEAYGLIHGRQVDLVDTTVVETGRSGEGDMAGGRIRVRRLSPDDIEIETETPGPAMLVLPLSPHGFREISIDGHAAAGFPADLCLTAVPMPAGHHRARVKERLPGGKGALAFFLAGASLLSLMALRRNQ
jgi:hypothetical protein